MAFFRELRDEYGDLQLVGTSAHARQRVYEVSFWRPTVLLIGNETDGLSRAYRDLADVMLAVPVQGSATSLNVACAASVVLYEVHRQRAR